MFTPARSHAALLVTSIMLAFAAEPARADLTWASGLIGLSVGPQSFPIEKPVLKPFASDGCSASPDGMLLSGKDEWVDCCIAHDIAYWVGGTHEERLDADHKLAQCITAVDYPKIALAYLAGVRAGGAPLTSLSFRWGYGWNRNRPYGPLTPEEREQAETLYGFGLIELHDFLAARALPIARTPPDLFDPSTIELTAEEVKIYNFLKRALKTPDIVTVVERFGRPAVRDYSLTLKNCKSATIDFRFERRLKKVTVTDLGGCLVTKEFTEPTNASANQATR